jgi:polyhydroxyalkanoate synthesis regulator phasin
MAQDQWDDLVDHVVRTTLLPAATARRVVDEVVAYFHESTEEVVRRRHRELQAAGESNTEIFRIIATELEDRPVVAPALSERQIRRLIYG